MKAKADLEKLIRVFKLLFILLGIFLCVVCKPKVEVINVGYIGPLSNRATDLGVAPANALRMAVDEYNSGRKNNQPQINLFVEDDKWEKENAIPAYEKLRQEHDIKVVFISNSDGTITLSDRVLEDDIILVNPLNNDSILSSLNPNTFKIAKSTEQANSLIAIRIIELGLKKVIVLQYPNNFMSLASKSCKNLFDEHNIESKIVKVEKDKINFIKELKSYKEEGYDAYVFFGYKEFGYAMKQARDLGIEAPFFGSTVLLVPEYYKNSEGTIIGAECSYFTPPDGNWVLAHEFLEKYKDAYGEKPFSIWPPLQAYDAMNLVINELKTIDATKGREVDFDDWLRDRLFDVDFFQGTCGNLSIQEDGSSKGIYFSLYKYETEGKIVKVKR